MTTTIPAGSRLLAEVLLPVTDQVDELQDVWPDTWTATLTNIVTTGGAVVARYLQVGKTIDFLWKFTTGAGSSVSSGARITLPVAPAAHYASSSGAVELARVVMLNAGTNRYWGNATLVSGSTIDLLYYPSGGAAAVVGGTAPFTWATNIASGNVLSVTGRYEAA